MQDDGHEVGGGRLPKLVKRPLELVPIAGLDPEIGEPRLLKMHQPAPSLDELFDGGAEYVLRDLEHEGVPVARRVGGTGEQVWRGEAGNARLWDAERRRDGGEPNVRPERTDDFRSAEEGVVVEPANEPPRLQARTRLHERPEDVLPAQHPVREVVEPRLTLRLYEEV